MNDPRDKRITKNIKFGSIGSIISLLISAIASSVFYKSLGPLYFGIYTLFTGFSAYIFLFDFGLSKSYLFWFSKYLARNDYTKINRLIFNGTIVYLFFSLVFVLICILFEKQFFNFLKIDSNLTLNNSYLIVLFSLFFTVPFNWASVFIIAAKKNDILSLIISTHVVITNLLLIILAKVGINFTYFIMTSCITNILLICIMIIYIKRNYQFIKYEPYFNMKEVFLLFKMSWKFQVDSLSAFFLFNISKLFLSNQYGPASVSYYEIGLKYTNAVTRMLSNVPTVIVPEASDYVEKGNINELRALFLKGTFYFSVIYIPIIFLAIYISKDFIFLWFGEKLTIAGDVSIFLLLSALLQFSTSFMSPITLAAGKIGITMVSSIIVTAIFIVVTPLLTFLYGIVGIAVSNMIGIFLGELYLWVRFHRIIISSSINETLKHCFVRPIRSAALSLFTVFSLSYLVNQHWHISSLNLLVNISFSSFVFVITYFVFSSIAGISLFSLFIKILKS